ncbi:n-acetylglutamate synthase [Spongiimicrobium salis]|uniref:n-acetylglutamate synthase n=1 Tax=Spongiimicrobium salis TaxID=1667022 RepID=UPI00374D8D9E
MKNHINYHGKRFSVVENSGNGQLGSTTFFEYTQNGNILHCEYTGEHIIYGQLLGIVDQEGKINMRYHQIDKEGNIRTGICHSKPEIMENGKIRLHESWEWTSGDCSKGNSILEEC